MQNLSGTLPDVGSAVASKLRALNVGDTGLQQCQPSHLAALGSKNYTGKVRPDCFGIILAVQGGYVGCSGNILACQGLSRLFRDCFGCLGTVSAVWGLTWLVRGYVGCLGITLAV